ERQRIQRPRLAGGKSGIDLIGRHLDPAIGRIEAVEAARELDDGAIATGGDIGNDGAHGRLDVRGGPAVAGDESSETLGDILGAGVEADRHGPVLPDRTGRVAGQWRGGNGPSTPQVGGVVAVDRTGGRRPRGPQIDQLGLQTLDLEPQHSSTRKNEVYDPGRRAGLKKLDCEQVYHFGLSPPMRVWALATHDPPKT